MGVAAEQGEQNQALNAEQTYANRPDVSTPWGSLDYTTGSTIDPATGQNVTTWGENVNLSPSEQAALTSQQTIQQGDSNTAQNLLSGIQSQINQPQITAPNEQALTGAGQGIDYNPSMLNGQAEDAVWNQFQNMQLPLQQQQTQATQAQLEAQGLRPGDAAYDTQMANLQNTQYAQDQTAEDQAVTAGQSEAATLFGEGNQAQAQGFGQLATQNSMNNAMISGNLANEASALGLSQSGADYDLNLMNGLLNGQQVSMPSFPSSSQASQAQSANLLQAAEAQGNADLNTYNAQVGNANATDSDIASGLGTAAAAAAFYFSDARLKTDIKRVGTTDDGIPIYTYRFKGSPVVQMGVLAQEVPHLTATSPEGYLMVDYSKVA
jgi:hypothetical protein